MDFFEHQEAARRKTRSLIPYFVFAVISAVISIYWAFLLGSYLFNYLDFFARFSSHMRETQFTGDKFILWRQDVFLYAILSSSGIILVTIICKEVELNTGGAAVARRLFADKISPHTIDFKKRRLLNVVEEMAIASGIPVPDVFLLNYETGINAFTAGKTPSDAVIGVTRGTVKYLNRDELQGIIAHEFSHILNGDIRLNMRLIGPLDGIEVIAKSGKSILRGVARLGAYTGFWIASFILLIVPVVFGVGLMVIGSSGLFFGRLIKAAVSRQREFLADASAVQFTRNPIGVSGALKKIGSRGSYIDDPNVVGLSYMFICSTFASKFFATHPPLEARIERIDPTWDGVYPELITRVSTVNKALLPQNKLKLPLLSSEVMMGFGGNEIINSIGHPGQDQISYSQELLSQFPEKWLEAVRKKSGAQAMIFALLLSPEEGLRAKEIYQLENDVDPYTWQKSQEFYAGMTGLHSASKIALIDLAMPALRDLTVAEYERFRAIIQNLIENDGLMGLFEFSLQKIINRHLGLYFNTVRPAKVRYRRVAKLKEEAEVLLSVLATLGGRGRDQALNAFRQGAEIIEQEIRGTLQFIEGEGCGPKQIDEALDRCDQAAPLVKKCLLNACGNTVMADKQATSGEFELLRAIADTIGCPIPLFVRN